LTNIFEVPQDLKNKGISKAMYDYLNKIGYQSVASSYSSSSDNFQAFEKVYDPFKLNLVQAIMATPAAKAMGSGFYPSIITPQYKNNQMTGVSVFWTRK
jgi:hypothetical protein